jgi:hypothetical protein
MENGDAQEVCLAKMIADLQSELDTLTRHEMIERYGSSSKNTILQTIFTAAVACSVNEETVFASSGRGARATLAALAEKK